MIFFEVERGGQSGSHHWPARHRRFPRRRPTEFRAFARSRRRVHHSHLFRHPLRRMPWCRPKPVWFQVWSQNLTKNRVVSLGFFFLGAARPRRPAIFSHACWRGLRPYTRGSVPAGFGLLRSGLLVSPGAADLPHRIKAVLFFVRVQMQQRRRKLKAAARECVARHRAMLKGRGCRGVGDALSSPPFWACVWVLGSPFGARAAFFLYIGCACVICVEAVWTRKNKKLGRSRGH